MERIMVMKIGGDDDTVGAYQGGGSDNIYVAVLDATGDREELVMELDETWEEIAPNGYWKRGTNSTFDIHIINLDLGSYLCVAPEKALEK